MIRRWLPRSVWMTTNTRSVCDIPNVINLGSACECFKSGIVSDCSSPKIVPLGIQVFPEREGEHRYAEMPACQMRGEL